MTYFDVDSARIDAQYHEEKLKRQVMDSSADIKYIAGLLQNAASTVASLFRTTKKYNAEKRTTGPIGDMQTNIN